MPEAEDRVRGWVTFALYRHGGEGMALPDPAALGANEDISERGGDGRWRLRRRRVKHVFARPSDG